jgi:hypothetical protein
MAYIPNEQNVRPVFNFQVHSAMEINIPINRPIHIYVLGCCTDISQYKSVTPYVHSVSDYTSEVESNSIIIWINGNIRFEKSNWNIYVPRVLNGFLDVVELASHYEGDDIKSSSIGYQNMIGLPIKNMSTYAVAMLSETATNISSISNMREYTDDYRFGYLPGKIWISN